MSADAVPSVETSAPPAVAPQPPAGTEPPAPAAPSPSPEPVGSLIGEVPKEAPAEPPKGDGKEVPKEVPKEQPKVADGPPANGRYEPFKLPEGVELEPAALASASKFMAEELKLPQERAQALVDFHVKALQTEAEAPYQLWEKTQREWQDQVKADPEIGGDNLPNVKVRVAKLLDGLKGTTGQKMKEALAFTGAGNNPDIIRGLYQMAERLTEGTFVPSGGASQGPRSAEQVLYPSMFEGKK